MCPSRISDPPGEPGVKRGVDSRGRATRGALGASDGQSQTEGSYETRTRGRHHPMSLRDADVREVNICDEGGRSELQAPPSTARARRSGGLRLGCCNIGVPLRLTQHHRLLDDVGRFLTFASGSMLYLKMLL